MLDVAVSVDLRRAFEIHVEADAHAPVEEDAVHDVGVADLGLVFAEVGLGFHFAGEDGELGGLGVA